MISIPGPMGRRCPMIPERTGLPITNKDSLGVAGNFLSRCKLRAD